jgi:hypothetical protein
MRSAARDRDGDASPLDALEGAMAEAWAANRNW